MKARILAVELNYLAKPVGKWLTLFSIMGIVGFMYNDLFVVQGTPYDSRSGIEKIAAACLSLKSGTWDCFDTECSGLTERLVVPICWEIYCKYHLIGKKNAFAERVVDF
ncbi:MAG: hypothetical protein R3F51_19685 [Cyanobacteriota/Melainabacteria group bacterium]